MAATQTTTRCRYPHKSSPAICILFTNFTFGKVLGTRDGSTSNGNGNGSVVNPFSLVPTTAPGSMTTPRSSTSPSATSCPSHPQQCILGEAVNGWQISRYTTYEDGAPYQATIPT